MFLKLKFKKFSGSEIIREAPQPGSLLALIISVGGNLALASVFLRSLLNPVAHSEFIVKTGIWLFMAEFLSIPSSGGGGLINSFRATGNILGSAIGFSIIAVFALTFGWAFLGNLYLPLIFLGSTLVKIFERKAIASSNLYAIPLLLGSLVFVFFILGPELLVRLFPLPKDFSQFAPPDWVVRHERGDISGEFVDRPQTMLVWGIIYFTLAAVIELFQYFKSFKIKVE